MCVWFVFFKQRRAYELRISDWSSDMCSSDLWRVGVPGLGEEYTITLDEDTLPEGIAVVDPEDDSPNVKEVEVGAGGRVTVNFFIGEGERNVTSFFDQLVQRTIQGLSFGLMLAPARSEARRVGRECGST